MANKDNLGINPGPTKAKQAGTNQKKYKQRLIEKLRAVGVEVTDKMTQAQMLKELDRIKKEGIVVPDLRAGNSHPLSLSKDPVIADMKRGHLMEEVDVVINDKTTGRTRKEKRNTLLAILDVLRRKAINDKDVAAAREYLDRTLGKSKMEIEMSNIKPEEQRPPTKAEMAAAKAYEDELEDEDDE